MVALRAASRSLKPTRLGSTGRTDLYTSIGCLPRSLPVHTRRVLAKKCYLSDADRRSLSAWNWGSSRPVAAWITSQVTFTTLVEHQRHNRSQLGLAGTSRIRQQYFSNRKRIHASGDD